MTAPTTPRIIRLVDARRKLDSDEAEISSPYLLRLNYGLAGLKVRQVCIVDGYWIHTFHLTLPTEVRSDQTVDTRARNVDPPTPTSLTDTGMNSSLVCKGPCHQLEGLLRARTALGLATSNSIGRLTDRITALLPDFMNLLRVRRRKSRGLLDFVGDASSFLFGTATNSDVESLRKDIRNIKAWADAATTDSARTRERMSSFAMLYNSCMDAIAPL